jgi:hypothetical protein
MMGDFGKEVSPPLGKIKKPETAQVLKKTARPC